MERRTQQESTIRHFIRARVTLGMAVAVAALFGTTAIKTAQAQSTDASIHGHAPAGQVVVVESSVGVHRKTTVHDNGRYVFHMLPLGVYKVLLYKNGKVVDSQGHVPLSVGRGMEVDFGCPHDHCAASKDSKHSS